MPCVYENIPYYFTARSSRLKLLGNGQYHFLIRLLNHFKCMNFMHLKWFSNHEMK